MLKKLYFIFVVPLFIFVGYYLFSPLYFQNSVIINYGLHPYDICVKQPELWKYLKCAFIIFYFLSSIILSSFIYNFFNQKIISKMHLNKKFSHLKNKNINIKNNINDKNDLFLLIGKNEKNDYIFIPEKGLYQNIFITGTIGSGKTSSAIYPFSKQLIKYCSNNKYKKIGMLILDVKGNLYKQISTFCRTFHRENDLIIIEIGGKYKYNPLDKPNLKPSILANRLKTILLLFSQNNSESYWLDKAEQILTETIKLCRLYNNNYVTFEEIHKLVSDKNYYLEKINILKEKFTDNYFSKEDCYNLLTAINFYENEFLKLDARTLSILKSEITRITNCFISDYQVKNTFNPIKKQSNFNGLYQIINSGKIVVLNMNIAEYRNLSKIIAAYLKLDFQSEVLSRLSNNTIKNGRSVAFICDEYHEYVTSTDADFFSQSREAKCINIVATQSYTSLLNTLNNQYSVKVIVQNLINKLWLRTDDIFTIEEAQKQIGKEDKEKFSKNISENANETNYSYFSNCLKSNKSSISESINTYFQYDYIFDTNFFTQKLETFTCLSFLSDGNKILPPQKINLIPYFKKGVKDE